MSNTGLFPGSTYIHVLCYLRYTVTSTHAMTMSTESWSRSDKTTKATTVIVHTTLSTVNELRLGSTPMMEASREPDSTTRGTMHERTREITASEHNKQTKPSLFLTTTLLDVTSHEALSPTSKVHIGRCRDITGTRHIRHS